jgi:thiol:disulfide interchange protein
MMPTAQTPPTRAPRSPRTILFQSMFFVVAFVLIAVVSYRLYTSRRVAGSGAITVIDHIPWRTNLPAALEESRKTGKPVLVDFSASWCPPCQEMRRSSWPDPRVGQQVNSGYIPVLMDADSPDSAEPASRYGIQLIPAILVLDSGGNVVRDGGFMSADQLVEFLKIGSHAG